MKIGSFFHSNNVQSINKNRVSFKWIRFKFTRQCFFKASVFIHFYKDTEFEKRIFFQLDFKTRGNPPKRVARNCLRKKELQEIRWFPTRFSRSLFLIIVPHGCVLRSKIILCQSGNAVSVILQTLRFDKYYFLNLTPTL